MAAKTRLLLVGLIGVAASGCLRPYFDVTLDPIQGIKFEDIEKAQTRHQLREVERRFETHNGVYRIGIPDVLNINVPDHPDLSGAYEVRPDGNVSFPLLKDVYVEGRTPGELANYLQKELERFVKKVDVLVTISGMYSKRAYVSTRSHTSVHTHRFTGDMTVLDLLGAEGGYTKEAYSSRMRLMRDNPTGKEIYKIRADMIMRGDFRTNIQVKDRDMLYLPSTVFFEIVYVCDMLTSPARSLLTGVKTYTELPYAADYGKQRASSGTGATY
jgi:polysaccharide export outer membrane protein